MGINLFEMEIKPKEVQAEMTRDRIIHSHVKRVVEALLFASKEPLPLVKIREITDTITPLKPAALKELILELQQEYLSERRSFRLEEIGDGYLLRSSEEFTPYIEQLGTSRRGEKLTQASAEVLAIIAYKQPVTRPQIDNIRGVDSSGAVYNLLERQLIEPVGKLEAPGRPTLYGTTVEFLKHFGLKTIQDLRKS